MPESQDQFDWSSIAPGDEHYQIAREEYHAGRSFPEIMATLERRGLSPDLTPQVMTALAQDRALRLFAAGKRRAEVRDILAGRGLSGEEAEYITRTVEGSRNRAFASAGLGKWQTRSLIAGGVLLMAGVVLYGLKGLGVLDVAGELIMGLMGSGVVLAGFGGVYIAFSVR